MPLVTDLPEGAKTVHLMGVAGTAMGALAGLLVDAGYTVTGSDKAVYPPMSDVLANLGVSVMEGFVAKNLDKKPDAVVVGNVIRAVYEEAQAVVERDLPDGALFSAADALLAEIGHAKVLAKETFFSFVTQRTLDFMGATDAEPEA